MKFKAEMGHWSSIVGNSVHLIGEDGRFLGQIAIMCQDDRLREKDVQTEICEKICTALNADLCASGQRVRAVEMLGELLAYDEWRMHNGGVVPDRFLGVINRARDAYRAALTPAPQPSAATPTAQEAVACLHGYCDAENCPACSQDQEVAQPTEDELDEAWKSGFNAGFGESKLTAHPPQPSEMIAAVERAFDEIRELNMSGRDENGHRWANSDLIDQTVTEGLVALRALKGSDNG